MKKILLVILVGFSFFNCKDNPKKADPYSKATAKEKTEAPAPKEEKIPVEGTLVELESDDMMKYNKSEIRVPAGQKVTLVLKHVGKMSKDVMGHNFVLLKQGVDMATFAGVASAAKDNDYIPADTKDIIAHTKTLGGGETTYIIFDAPEKGTYEFLCSFPAHYAMMKGQFIVE
ncbi:MAG: azurin [Flavobacteriaceae bacterium]|nr:azurin [Flavobacteriaceae bacterium]